MRNIGKTLISHKLLDQPSCNKWASLIPADQKKREKAKGHLKLHRQEETSRWIRNPVLHVTKVKHHQSRLNRRPRKTEGHKNGTEREQTDFFQRISNQLFLGSMGDPSCPVKSRRERVTSCSFTQSHKVCVVGVLAHQQSLHVRVFPESHSV